MKTGPPPSPKASPRPSPGPAQLALLPGQKRQPAGRRSGLLFALLVRSPRSAGKALGHNCL